MMKLLDQNLHCIISKCKPVRYKAEGFCFGKETACKQWLVQWRDSKRNEAARKKGKML